MTKNWAIVIGINRYDHLQSLDYAGQDALRISAFLQQELEFHKIFLFTDDSPNIGRHSTRPTLTNLLKILDEIFATPFMGTGDSFWFFFSGHGIPHQGRDYLMPADGYPSNVERTAISVDDIRDKLRDCGADNVIMILDACRKSSTRAGEGIGRQSAEAARQTGVITFFSCSPNQFSYEIADLQQGAFTYALIEGLGIRGKCATIERLDQYLSQRVPELVRQYKHDEQIPYTIAEPITKSYLILNRRYATRSDIAVLKNDAYQAEIHQDYPLAQQLWIQVLAAANGSDIDAINAIQRVALRQFGTATSPPSFSETTVSDKSSRPDSPSLQETTASPSDSISNDFTDYRKVLTKLIRDLERLRHYSQILSLNDSIQHIDNVLEKVHSNSFSIAVVGEFKRGRSTFINALLGEEILPVDLLPCTATLTRVTYGTTPRGKIVYRDGCEEEIAIDQLADYVTQLTPESEETAVNIKEAIVYYPVFYCQNNVDIIDTPGLNDVTLSLLPHVDAVIMVIMAQCPLNESETEFLNTQLLANDLGRIIFVVTGIDRLNSEDSVNSLNYVKYRILKLVLQRGKDQYGEDAPEYEVYQKKIESLRVFGVSGYQALQAKLTGDLELLAKSCFSEFEAALEYFLTHERGYLFLEIPINQLIASSTEILSALNLRQSASTTLNEQQKREISLMMTETYQILDNAHWLSENLHASKPQPSSEHLDDDLSSECNASYTKLCNFLKAKQWQEANQETELVMLKVAGCEKLGWLDSSAIDCFPITDLRTIDRLWLKYTNRHFGFSIQKKIFTQVNQKEQSFLQKVNWTKASLKGGIFLKENHLHFSLEAPEGHLPLVFGGEHSWIFSVL
jgi:uncharacterized caspase-like protein/predicted GTPase